MKGDNVMDLETTVTLTRVEFDDPEMANFCFEIKAREAGVAFALTVPVPDAELHQMWLTAYHTLSATLYNAAKVAEGLAERHARTEVKELPPMTAEEQLLRSIFQESASRPAVDQTGSGNFGQP
jgi:hypothetical protein